MSENGQAASRGELNEEVVRKLDVGLLRLLRMTEAEIRREVEAQEARMAERLAEIERLADILPPTAVPLERQAVERVQAMQRARVRPHPIFGTVIVDETEIAPAKARAFVHFAGNRDDLAALGLEVRTRGHDVFVVAGTVSQLASLAAQPATLRMQLPVLQVPGVEHATAQAQVSDVQQHYQGKDVIVGVIDTPLDVAHHAFRDSDPKGTHGTRVLYYWVQDASADPTKEPGAVDPAFKGFHGGRLYTSSDINNALGLAAGPYGAGKDQIACQPLVLGHGTAVAGVAVGNGYGPDWNATPVHIGAAPQATLVHVAAATLQGCDTIEGMDFTFRVAESLNRAAVVLISHGDNSGPHRGTDLRDYFIDSALNSYQERVVVGIAQNWNDKDGFRCGTIAAGGTDQFTLTAAPYTADLVLDIWCAGAATLTFKLGIGGSSSGAWATSFDGKLGGYDVYGQFFSEELAMNRLYLVIRAASPSAPIDIELHNSDGQQITYYAWLWPDAAGGMPATLSGATHNELTLDNTGCCKSMLTVGACVKVVPPDPSAGELAADFSGAGPTLDGRIKPEIVAVGGGVFSASSHPSADQDRGYQAANFGTSCAGALVAGAVAQLFEDARQRGYRLDSDTVKALLTRHADRSGLHLDPAQPGYNAIERNRYGHGRLRMFGPIEALAPPNDVDLWVRTADDDYGNEPYIGNCFWASPDITVAPEGGLTSVTQLEWGLTYDLLVTVRNLGDRKAFGATVRLRYTRPLVAPGEWVLAKSPVGAALQKDIDVPALGKVHELFKWRPAGSDFTSPPPPGSSHFCVIAEVHHDDDPLPKGDDAWEIAIKHTNNRALRNVIIR